MEDTLEDSELDGEEVTVEEAVDDCVVVNVDETLEETVDDTDRVAEVVSVLEILVV